MNREQRRCLVSLSMVFIPGRTTSLHDVTCTFEFDPVAYKSPTVLGYQFIHLAKDTQFLRHFGESVGRRPSKLDSKWKSQGYEKLFTEEGYLGQGENAVRAFGKGSQRLKVVAEGQLGKEPGAIETVPLCILLKFHERSPSVLTANVSLSARTSTTRCVMLPKLARCPSVKRKFEAVILSPGPCLPLLAGDTYSTSAFYGPSPPDLRLRQEPMATTAAEEVPAMTVTAPEASRAPPAQNGGAMAGTAGSSGRVALDRSGSLGAPEGKIRRKRDEDSALHRELKRTKTLPAGSLRAKARFQLDNAVASYSEKATEKSIGQEKEDTAAACVDTIREIFRKADERFLASWLGVREEIFLVELRKRYGSNFPAEHGFTWNDVPGAISTVFAEERVRRDGAVHSSSRRGAAARPPQTSSSVTYPAQPALRHRQRYEA